MTDADADYAWTFTASVGDVLPPHERTDFELSEIERALNKRGLVLDERTLAVGECSCRRCKARRKTAVPSLQPGAFYVARADG